MSSSRNPYPALVAVLAVPALVLGGSWWYASSKTPEPVATVTTASTDVPHALSVPLLSTRRAPAVLSRSVSLPAFRDTASAAFSTLTDTECVSISIDGAAVVAVHPHVPLRPASNVKLFTAAVALDVLGADHTFHTDVRGDVQVGTVRGDLYLVGGGDPVLSSSWWHGSNPAYAPFNTTSIDELARRVKAAGVTRVDGDVVGDATRYDDEWYPPSWPKSIRFTEGGPVSALLVNDAREAPNKASADPSVGAATVFIGALRAAGIEVRGQARSGAAPAGTASIAGIDSHPLSEVVAEMLTTSDNTTAELMLKEIGAVVQQRGTREAGLGVVRERLAAWGIPQQEVDLSDGSGLSDDNRATCAALGTLLDRTTVTEPLGAGLAVAGASGGTLSNSFVGTALEGRLRAKTGTLSNSADGPGGKPGAKALSGYVPVDGGGNVRFVMLLNGPTITDLAEYGPWWKALGSVLSSYPSGPTPAEVVHP